MTMLARRDLMRGTAGIVALAAAGPARAQARRFLGSDIGQLGRVLVHSLSDADTGHDRLRSLLLPDADADIPAAARQHRALNDLLRAAGARPVELVDALDAAIAATRRSGVFEAWLRASFPRLAGAPDRVTSAMLLGRDPAIRFALGADGDWRAMADATNSTMWTRDSAVMTPNGLLVCNAASARRRRENMLLRFVYRHSPLLADFPIAFDAVEEGLIVEGGDMMIVSPTMMFLGVGNRSDPRIAPVLARRLGMDVLTVQTVERSFLGQPRQQGNQTLQELRVLLLHLDTFFTHVAPRHGLAVPFLLERDHCEDNPLARFIRGARADTLLEEEEAKGALDMLRGFGKVTLYARGTGRKDALGDLKLVDWLRQERYRLTWVGGARPRGDLDAFRHFMETAYPELRRQAANVLQAQPGRVIAYAGNPATKAALEADGIGVDTFEARELWAWHGGPHCLTQPLERT
jgi:arginine deiminase